MKKLFLLFLMTLLFASIISAEGIEGVFGMKWGASPDDALKVMEERGWKLTETDEDNLEFENPEGTFAGLSVMSTNLSFDNFWYEGLISLSGAQIFMEPIPRDEEAQETVNTQKKVISALVDLYGLSYVQGDEKNTDDGYYVCQCQFQDANGTVFVYQYLISDELICLSFCFLDKASYNYPESSFELNRGFNGAFGIDFGASSAEVKKKMTAKGWNPSEGDSPIIFTKPHGSFANIPVGYVSFDFEDDSLTDVMIITEPVLLNKENTEKLEDIWVLLAVTADLYELASIEESEYKSMKKVVYADPNGNRFTKVFLIYNNTLTMTINFSMCGEKKEE